MVPVSVNYLKHVDYIRICRLCVYFLCSRYIFLYVCLSRRVITIHILIVFSEYLFALAAFVHSVLINTTDRCFNIAANYYIKCDNINDIKFMWAQVKIFLRPDHAVYSEKTNPMIYILYINSERLIQQNTTKYKQIVRVVFIIYT